MQVRIAEGIVALFNKGSNRKSDPALGADVNAAMQGCQQFSGITNNGRSIGVAAFSVLAANQANF
jgi:hypothetical protein